MFKMAPVVRPAWQATTVRWARRRLFGWAAWALWPCVADAGGISWHAPLEIARGGGERGPWQQNESRFRFVDDASVAWSPRGELAVVWADQASKAVLLRRVPASGIDTPVDVSRQPATFPWLPRMAWAPDANGRLHVLWQAIVFSGGSHGGEVMTAVSHGAPAAGYPALGVDARGRGVVRWERVHGIGLMTSYGLGIAVSDDGRVFEAPQQVPDSVDRGGGANSSTQGRLMRKLAVRPGGQVAIVNSALKPGSHSRVWLMRGTLH
jgi:hypothetical protein